MTKDDNIHVSTGYGTGVSSVKVGVANARRRLKGVPVSMVTVRLSLSQLKTVYYQTTASTQSCNFDLSVEVVHPSTANSQ